MPRPKTILIVHNVRSSSNVGSLLRTSDGLGVSQVILTGYTPYPQHIGDERLPHVAQRTDRRISKTALGAQLNINWRHQNDIFPVITEMKAAGYQIVGLEQSLEAKKLDELSPASKTALVVGSETTGLEPDILQAMHEIVEIPMQGSKESFNVSVAAAMALFFINLKRNRQM